MKFYGRTVPGEADHLSLGVKVDLLMHMCVISGLCLIDLR